MINHTSAGKGRVNYYAIVPLDDDYMSADSPVWSIVQWDYKFQCWALVTVPASFHETIVRLQFIDVKENDRD